MSIARLMQLAASAPTEPEGAWDLSYAYYDDPSQYDPASFKAVFGSGLSVGSRDPVPEGVYVSPDGVNLYIAGGLSSSAEVNQFTLSTPYYASSGTYRRVRSVSAEESNPQDIFFKPDGTKMYILGSSSDAVHEYTLSTAWNISTASFTTSFSISAQESNPKGLSFSDDGTKMYVVGTTGDDFDEYTLSTAWDVSTASHIQVISAVTNPEGVEISADGAAGLVLGNSNDVTGYTFSTPFDVSTRSTRGSAYTLAGTATASGIRVSGGFLYATDSLNDSVYQYAMGGTPYISIFQGIQFKPDGSRLFGLNASDHVVEVAVGTGFSVVDQVGSSSVVDGVTFKSDGTSVYLVAGSNIYQYSLNTAWDTSTMSYLQSFSVSAQEASPHDIHFKSDGTKMYILGVISGAVHEYDLSTAWDISTASYSQAFSVSAQETGPTGLFFKPDGTKMYVCGYSGDDVNEYELSTAWDVSTASYARVFSISGQETFPYGLAFNSDGTKMYVAGSNFDRIYQYNLSTAWLVTSASYVGSESLTDDQLNPYGIALKSDDTKVYVVGFFNNRTQNFLNEYDLPTAGDITDTRFRPVTDFWNLEYARQNQAFTGTGEVVPTDLFFKPDGTKMYVIGSSGDAVREFSLSAAWDVGTATFVRSFSVSGQETVPTGLFFKPDGKKMYICGSTGDDVNEYNLGTAWNVSTASYAQNFSVSAQDNTPQCVTFKPDGTKMYVGGGTNNSLFEYDLSTPWDISTAAYSSISLSFEASLSDVDGVVFHPDGTKMYTVLSGVGTTFKVYTYSLGVPE